MRTEILKLKIAKIIYKAFFDNTNIDDIELPEYMSIADEILKIIRKHLR